MNVKVICRTDLSCLQVEKRLEILEWLCAANVSSRHEAISAERVENTGTWFLQSEPFQNWLKGVRSNLLCYKGIRIFFAESADSFTAGAGKTFLT